MAQRAALLAAANARAAFMMHAIIASVVLVGVLYVIDCWREARTQRSALAQAALRAEAAHHYNMQQIAARQSAAEVRREQAHQSRIRRAA